MGLNGEGNLCNANSIVVKAASFFIDKPQKTW